MSRWASAIATLALVGVATVACGQPGSDRSGSVTTAATPPRPPPPSRPAWGRPYRSADTAGLLTAAVERNPNDPAIAEALGSADPQRYLHGAWTLARTWGPGSTSRLVSVLDATVPAGVDRAQLFASLALLAPLRRARGEPAQPQGPMMELEDAIWRRYAVTEDAEEASALLLATARVGGRRSVARLAVDLARVPPVAEQGRYEDGAVALGILCSRGLSLTKAGLEALANGIVATGASMRDAAAYALGRCAGPSAELFAGDQRKTVAERLGPMLDAAASAPQSARLAWRALAGIGEIPDPIPEEILSDGSVPWQVTVQAVRALVATAEGRTLVAQRLAALDLAAFGGPHMHAVLVALHGLRAGVADAPRLLVKLRPFARRLQARIEDPTAAADLRPLVLARCEHALLSVIASGQTDPLERCGHPEVTLPEGYGKMLSVEAQLHRRATGDDGLARADALLGLVDDARPLVATRAISALAEVDDARVSPALRAALERKDVGVVAAAAAAIAARSADAAKRDPEAIDALRGLVRELDNADAVEARIAAIDALAGLSIEGKAADANNEGASPSPPKWLEGTMLPLAGDPNVAVRRAALRAVYGYPRLRGRFDASTPAGFPEAVSEPVRQALDQSAGQRPVSMRIATGVGMIDVDLRSAPAPVAHATLASLAERGYFDGLKFHRVVPDFVVQGGDPRGDGYGGPGYLIPCEWSNLRYERGTVGIALAGKDTGGSQLFITHSPQPHLDARYTVVGHVTGGMDVLDRIFSYEPIERIEVSRAGP